MSSEGELGEQVPAIPGKEAVLIWYSWYPVAHSVGNNFCRKDAMSVCGSPIKDRDRINYMHSIRAIFSMLVYLLKQ